MLGNDIVTIRRRRMRVEIGGLEESGLKET